MKGFKSNIEKDTLKNSNFRKVLYTGNYLQLVLMSLKIGEDIGEEIHFENDRFFRIESGLGKFMIDGHEYIVKDGDVVVVPAGALHNVQNIDIKTDLKMCTIYAPPHHQDGLIRATKAEAEKYGVEYDGKPTELELIY